MKQFNKCLEAYPIPEYSVTTVTAGKLVKCSVCLMHQMRCTETKGQILKPRSLGRSFDG